MSLEDFKKDIENHVNKSIEGALMYAHLLGDTQSGDITPEQEVELNKLKRQLTELIVNQVLQNKPQKLK